MPNYISRKKTLMGRNFTKDISLDQYGGDIVRVHAIPDMELARLEDRTRYSLQEATRALFSQDLSDEEVAALSVAELPAELIKKVSETFTAEELDAIRSDTPPSVLEKRLTKCFSVEEVRLIKTKPASNKLKMKAASGMTAKLALFLGELCKVGIVPNPDCVCKGKGCEDCDVNEMVEDFKGYTIYHVGMAIIEVSSTDWKDVEAFFLAQRASSGAV